MLRISEFCQRVEHDRCPTVGRDDYPNCQCECHLGTMPGTTEGGEGIRTERPAT
jgi:hypothetical protein